MNFREAYQDDLANAFFDEDGFASRHTIDGKECTVILAEARREGARKYYTRAQSTFNQKETAVDRASHVVYVRETDMQRRPAVNAVISLDGRKYFVLDVRLHEGVYTLVIGIHAV